MQLTNRRALLTLAIAAMATPFAPLAHAAHAPDWLLGRWELTHDDDGSPTDYMEFHEGAEVLSIGALPPGIRSVTV